jgi:NAD(P)H dehydrogenase (quinone)
MTIVVTGATGNLGRLIVEALLRNGTPASDIVAGGRDLQKLAHLRARGVRVARIDYTDEASLAEAFSGADTLMLVSGNELGQRVAQHSAAIDAAKAAGISRIVYTSAPRADSTTLVLAPEHKLTEEYLVASGVPFTVLRNGWYTEVYSGAAEQARESGVIAASVGDGMVASASRADYADAAAVVLAGTGFDGKVFELSGDTAWNYTELAAVVSELIDRDVTFTPLSADEHLALLTSGGLDDATAGFVVALDADIRNGLLAETSGELSKLIGRPTTPLHAGLAAAL